MRDEGRPFEASFQERASNHPKLLRSKAVVVSVGVKVRKYNLRTGTVRGDSPAALTAMRQKARRLNYRKRMDLSFQDIASKLNPTLRGWIAYYGRFQPSALGPLYRSINTSLVAWARRKYKRFRTSKTRAATFLLKISRKCPHLFAHWKRGTASVFA